MRLVLALLIAVAPAWALAQPKPAPAMPVRAAPAKVAPAVDEATAVGTLRADESIVIRPEIAGRVAEIRFNEGQRVARGDILVRLDQAELAAVLASSRAQAGLDKQRLERAEDLLRKSFISQQAFDEARANYARSAAKQREDEARLAKTEIRAPFDGVAGLRQVSEGAYVAAGTDIARLEKIDQLKLDFRVPEIYVARLKPGQAVRVQLDAYGELGFPGAVYAIEPAVDEATRTVLVRARVPNREGKLRPGMFARVWAHLAVRENAVWVPEQAIVPRGQDTYVFRVVEGKVELVRVQTGVRKAGEVEITRGIAPGEMVVTEGVQRLGPGTAVTVVPGNAKPAAAAPDKKG